MASVPVVRRYYRVYRLLRRSCKLYKLFTMSDKGYLSNKREKRLARALDGFFDFKKIFGQKKILFGLINVGNTLEKNDYGIFLALMRVLDDAIVGRNMNIQAAAVLDNVLTFLETKDLDGFNGYVAGLLAGEINIPLVQDDKAAFLNVLNALKSLLNLAIARFETAVATSEAEDNQ